MQAVAFFRGIFKLAQESLRGIGIAIHLTLHAVQAALGIITQTGERGNLGIQLLDGAVAAANNFLGGAVQPEQEPVLFFLPGPFFLTLLLRLLGKCLRFALFFRQCPRHGLDDLALFIEHFIAVLHEFRRHL